MTCSIHHPRTVCKVRTCCLCNPCPALKQRILLRLYPNFAACAPPRVVGGPVYAAQVFTSNTFVAVEPFVDRTKACRLPWICKYLRTGSGAKSLTQPSEHQLLLDVPKEKAENEGKSSFIGIMSAPAHLTSSLRPLFEDENVWSQQNQILFFSLYYFLLLIYT